MITGTRKALDATGESPQTKAQRVREYEEMKEVEEEDMDEKMMIKEMWRMMKTMQKDTSQACISARKATQAAESAVKEVQQ
eukprot:98365-Karenia_brevis.AAC.1